MSTFCFAKRERLLTFRADEAPADVDVAVVAAALLGHEMTAANHHCSRQHLAARGNALVSCMVGHRAAQTTHHLPWSHKKRTQLLENIKITQFEGGKNKNKNVLYTSAQRKVTVDMLMTTRQHHSLSTDRHV